jgi:cation transport regulator
VPYESINDLPESVRNHLPPAAQHIYAEVFNHAWTEYADRADREAIAHRVAWSAVKRQYIKRGSQWVRKSP